MKLYSFFLSSTSYRVRIALALKRVAYEYVPVNLRRSEHLQPDYIALNASANVPLLVDGEMALGQSLAIVDYLDGCFPVPRLIPESPPLRARVLEFASLIGGDIHPVNNLRVLRYLQNELGLSDAQKNAWYAHWIAEGLAAAERLLTRQAGGPIAADPFAAGPFAFGNEPTLADCWLVPQVANALRMNCSIDAYPRTAGVYRHCIGLGAFRAAAPEAQPDFVQ